MKFFFLSKLLNLTPSGQRQLRVVYQNASSTFLPLFSERGGRVTFFAMTPGEILCEQILTLLEINSGIVISDREELAKLFFVRPELVARTLQEMKETALLQFDEVDSDFLEQLAEQENSADFENASNLASGQKRKKVGKERKYYYIITRPSSSSFGQIYKDIYLRSKYISYIYLSFTQSRKVTVARRPPKCPPLREEKTEENCTQYSEICGVSPVREEGTIRPVRLKRPNPSEKFYPDPAPDEDDLPIQSGKLIVPGTIKEIVELWNSLNFIPCIIANTKRFRSAWSKINRAKLGTLFKDIPGLENRKFTYDEIKKAMLNLYLAAYDHDYEPEGWKKEKHLRKIELTNFLYDPRRSVNLLLEYQNKPKLRAKHQDLPTEDKYPQISSVLRFFYKTTVLGGVKRELREVEEGKIRKGAERIVEFFKSNRDKFNRASIMGGVTAAKLAKWVVEAIMTNRKDDDKIPLQVGHLCSDYTFDIRLPQYLLQQGIWEADNE